MTKVSVMIPIYDGIPVAFVEKCFNSMVEQTFKDFEVIIFKNGIKGTFLNETIKRFTIRFPNIFRVMESKRNLGIPKAYNIMLPTIESEFVATQDADDWSDSKRLQKQYEFMTQAKMKVGKKYIDVKKIGVIGCSSFLVNEQGEIYNSFPVTRYATPWFGVMRNNFLVGGSSFARKEAIMDCDGYNEDYRYCWDYRLWVQMYIRGWEICNLEQSLYYHRIWPGQGSAKYKKRQKREHQKVIKLLNKYHDIKRSTK